MSSLLQLLPYFEAVARLGNFTRAANQLGVTPPAVSQNIQALENQLGCAYSTAPAARYVSATRAGCFTRRSRRR